MLTYQTFTEVTLDAAFITMYFVVVVFFFSIIIETDKPQVNHSTTRGHHHLNFDRVTLLMTFRQSWVCLCTTVELDLGLLVTQMSTPGENYSLAFPFISLTVVGAKLPISTLTSACYYSLQWIWIVATSFESATHG